MEKIILGITGASGAIYGVRMLRALLLSDMEVDCVISDYGKYVLTDELGDKDPGKILEKKYQFKIDPARVRYLPNVDLAAEISSGSNRCKGMVVCPCSMKTLSGIAHGYSTTLIERAADVTLKENRLLILVPRESPLNLIHLRNLQIVMEAGARIVPAMPAFYQKPQTFEELADFIACRVLNLLGIEHQLFQSWKK